MRTMMSLGLICSMAACVEPQTATPSDPSAGTDEATVGTTEQATTGKSLTAQDVKLGDGSEGGISTAQDCVFIQYCDEPPAGGTWKVVGKVRSSCFSQCFNTAIINEFIGDAKAVCGSTSLNDNKWRIDCF